MKIIMMDANLRIFFRALIFIILILINTLIGKI